MARKDWTMTEMREKIARAIAEKLIPVAWESKSGALAEIDGDSIVEAADAVLALYAPVMEENERLREAVEDIAKLARPQSYASERARAALSPKSEKQDG
jgi:hypothetical protein